MSWFKHNTGLFKFHDKEWSDKEGAMEYKGCELLQDIRYGDMKNEIPSIKNTITASSHNDDLCKKGTKIDLISQMSRELFGWIGDDLVLDVPIPAHLLDTETLSTSAKSEPTIGPAKSSSPPSRIVKSEITSTPQYEITSDPTHNSTTLNFEVPNKIVVETGSSKVADAVEYYNSLDGKDKEHVFIEAYGSICTTMHDTEKEDTIDPRVAKILPFFYDLTKDNSIMWSVYLEEFHGVKVARDQKKMALVPGTVIVPLNNPNHHDYTLHDPILVTGEEGCCRFGRYATGNKMSSKPDSSRPATRDEIIAFFAARHKLNKV